MEEFEFEGRKPFAAVIQEQRQGGLHGELSHELANLVASVQETRKPGVLTLTLKVTPNKDGVTVTLSDDISVKLPKSDRGAAIFFVQGDGNLVRNDPRQPELPLREVGAREATEIRKVGGES